MGEPVLLVMAAGMGSRYGGLKQIDPVGANGEIIIDYSLYDARKAGFKKAVFVIKEEHDQDFKEVILPRAGKYMDITFVYQKMTDIPDGCSVPEGRTKPWGTGHAVLAAAREINSPVVVINADDFYGREAFEKMYRFLVQATDKEKCDYAMVGFYLKNTVTENGFVSRGVCETEHGLLKNIVERTRIEKQGDEIAYSENDGETWNALSPDTIVSMNFWGFTPSIFSALQDDFQRFFAEDVQRNPLKAEFFLPFVVNDMLQDQKAEVKVFSSSDKWYGVTYKEDKKDVQHAIRTLSEQGKYPSPLWDSLESNRLL